MPQYVAFLRAINVGGHTVKMDRLRELFAADLGMDGVETFIASGNVIFGSAARNTRTLEQKIEATLQTALGYRVATFLRTPAELARIAASEPFPNSAPREAEHALHVGFTAEVIDVDRAARVAALSSAYDELRAEGRELYWLCRGRVSDSKITGVMLERALGAEATLRNVTTVRKLAAKYA